MASEPLTSETDDFLTERSAYSATSDVARLRQAYQNERNAPEILQYQEALVARVESLIADRESLMVRYEQDRERSFLVSMMNFDLVRVRCLLRMYRRARLRKLEDHVMSVLDDADAQDRLSSQEMTYAREYFVMMGRAFKDALLDHLPANFNSLVKQSAVSERKDMMEAPELRTHVFCRVTEDVGAVAVDDSGVEMQDFVVDDLYAVRYDRIRDLLARDEVELV